MGLMNTITKDSVFTRKRAGNMHEKFIPEEFN